MAPRSSGAAALAVALALAAAAHAQAPDASAPGLTLAQAIALARAHHPTVAQQKASVEAARARNQQAWAAFLPGLTGNITYQPQTANFAATPGLVRALSNQTSGMGQVLDVSGNVLNVTCSPVGGTCTPAPNSAFGTLPASYALYNFWSLGVGIQWTVFDFGRTYYNYRSAQAGRDSAVVGLTSAGRNVALDVKTAFFAAIAADTQVTVSEEAVATQRKHADQAHAFYEAGTKTKIDVASAESDVANAELTLARAHATRDQARAQLAFSIGEERWQGWRLVYEPAAFEWSPADERSLLDDASLERTALSGRTELRELELREKSYADQAKSARGAYLPALTLGLGPSWAGTELSSLTTNFTITLSLTYPTLGVNPIIVHGQAREARANQLLTAEQTRAQRNSIRLEAINARASLRAAHEEVTAALKLVTAATERRDLAEGRYQTGVGNIIELSDAQLAYVNARFQQVQAGLDVATARARLQHALGQDDR